MWSHRALSVPAVITTMTLSVVVACLPDNPATSMTAGSTGDTGSSSGEPTDTATPVTGLFACDSPPCKVLLVSQTLDDRVDVFDVGAATPFLRGRIALDLKPDPSGQQISGDLLDEPYDLALTPEELIVTVGHYPATDKGSLLRFPREAFAELAPGATFTTPDYFKNAVFSVGVEDLAHGRREGIFLLPHPSGRLLVGVFANDLKSTQWTTPSEVLVVDPADFSAAPASVDLGALEKPCIGAWQLVALDAEVSRVAFACDGSESIGVLTLPADFATATTTQAAAGMKGCSLNLGGGDAWTTQFVASDGAGGLLAIQTQIAQSPRLWHIDRDCKVTGLPSKEVPPDLKQVGLMHQPVLLRAAGEREPLWLVSSSLPESGVVVVRGGDSPTMCGKLGGLELLASGNAPWALALDPTGTHLAIGAGPPSNPALAEGKGQVLWAALDRSKEDTCEVTATDVIDLNAGLYTVSAPDTWVRAPNVLLLAELGGGA